MGSGEYGWDGYVLAYDLTELLSQADMADAIRVAEMVLEKADPKLLVRELTRLRALTVSRDQSTEDLGLMLAAYTEELREYPGDIVTDVLREWPRTHRFWPSLSELVERIVRSTAPRRALLDGLRRGYREPQRHPDFIDPPSPEEIERVNELLAKHGYSVDRQGRVRPPESTPLTAAERKRVAEECAAYRFVEADNAGVLERLRQMEEAR